MPFRLITNLVFYDDGKQHTQLIASGKEGCFIIDMEIKFKYDPVMAILLDPKGQSIRVKIKQPIRKENQLDHSDNHFGKSSHSKLQISQKKSVKSHKENQGGSNVQQSQNKGFNIDDKDNDRDFGHSRNDDYNSTSLNINNTRSVTRRRMDTIGDDNYDNFEFSQHHDNLPVNFDTLKYGSHIKQLQRLSQWVEGLKVFEEDNLIVAWRKENSSDDILESNATRISRIRPSKDYIVFYSLSNQQHYKQGEVWSHCHDPIFKNFITDILIFKVQKFFLTAHNNGDIILWELEEINSLENVTHDLSRKETVMNDPNKGMSSNGLDVNRMDVSSSMPSKNAKIHTFKGHSQTVTSLSPIAHRPTHFVSASTDGKVRIWDFDRLIELYCFDIQLDSPVQNSAMADTIENVKLINERVYAMIFKNKIEIGLISHLVSSNFITKQNIIGLGKCFDNHSKMIENKTEKFFISFDDNSVIVYNPEKQEVQSTVYPPPTSAEVNKVFYCMSIQRIFLFLTNKEMSTTDDQRFMFTNGQICVYNVEGDTGKLEKMQESKSLKDYEGKSLSQQITTISCCYTEPPKHDCEIFSDLHRYEEPTKPAYTFVNQEDGAKSDKFLVLGLSKGMIIFVRVDNLDHIFARFSIHQTAVLQIYEMPEQGTFFSICEAKKLSIWNFKLPNGKEGLNVAQTYDLHREVISIIVAQHQQLLICFQKGDSELLVWDEYDCEDVDTKKDGKQPGKIWALGKPQIMVADDDAKLQSIKDDDGEADKDDQEKEKDEPTVCFDVDNSDEHEDPITCFDVLLNKGFYVTGDKSGLVKIWNCKKQLVREIKFVEEISSVCFLGSERDLIVGHSGNLSRLDYKDYQNRKMEVKAEEYRDLRLGHKLKGSKQIQSDFFANLTTKEPSKKDNKQKSKEIKIEQQSTTKKKALEDNLISDKDTIELANENKETRSRFQQSKVQKEKDKAVKKPLPKASSGGDQSQSFNISMGQPFNKSAMPGAQNQQQSVSISGARTSPGIGSKETSPSGPGSNLMHIQAQDSPYNDQNIENASNSNMSSKMNSNIKAANMKMHLRELRHECVNIPSVPNSFMKNRQKILQREKKAQLMNNSTRRMITQQRIIQNIVKRNDPGDQVNFKDILVSQQSVSQGNLPFNSTMFGMNSSNTRMQGRTKTRGNTGRNVDARVGMSSGQIHFPRSNRSSKQEPKISRGQSAAFQGINRHVGAFGIQENDRFYDNRSHNYRMNQTGGLRFEPPSELPVLLNDHQRAFQQTPEGGGYVFVQMRGHHTGSHIEQARFMQLDARGRHGSLGSAASITSPYQTQPHHYIARVNLNNTGGNHHPESGLNLYRPNDIIRQSEEFMSTAQDHIDKAHVSRRGINRIDFKHSKQSSINQSPDAQGSASPQHQFFNSTLNKSNNSRGLKTVKDNRQNGSGSPNQTLFERNALSSNDDQQRFNLSGNRNESGASKFKDEERLTNIRSPNNDSQIMLDRDKTQTKRDGEQSAIKISTQPTLPIKDPSKQLDPVQIETKPSKDIEDIPAGKIEVQIEKKGELSPSQNSVENQSPEHQQINGAKIQDESKTTVAQKSNEMTEAQEIKRMQEPQLQHHMGVDDPSKSHQARLLIIQKVNKRGEEDNEATAITPEEAYQSYPQDLTGIKQMQSNVPNIPELQDIRGSNPQNQMKNQGYSLSAHSFIQQQQHQRDYPIQQTLQNQAIIIRQEQSAPGMHSDAQQTSMAALPQSERVDGLIHYEKQAMSQKANKPAEEMLKQYDSKIFGSQRAHSTNLFVATRRQQRVNQLKQVHTSLVTNLEDFRPNATLRIENQGLQQSSHAGSLPRGRINQNYMTSPQTSKSALKPLHFTSIGQRSADLNNDGTFKLRQLGTATGAHTSSLSPQERSHSPGFHGGNYVDQRRQYQIHQSQEAPQDHMKHFYGMGQSDMMSQQTRAGLLSQGRQQINSQHPSAYSGAIMNRNLHDKLNEPHLQDQMQPPKYQAMIHNQRKGHSAIKSAKGGNNVFVKNLMSHGLHMPSKGLFSQKALRKPATAGGYGSRGVYSSQQRRRNYNQDVKVASNDPQFAATDQENKFERHESEYRKNMKNIKLLQNQAVIRQQQHFELKAHQMGLVTYNAVPVHDTNDATDSA